MASKIKKDKRTAFSPPGREKKVHYSSPTYYSLSPSWGFSMLDLDFIYLHSSWTLCKNNNLSNGALKPQFCIAQIYQGLGEREKLTWGEIFNDDAIGDHIIDISQLKDKNPKAVNRIKEKFPTMFRENNIDTLCSIRLSSGCRLWGIIDKNTGIFNLLWWDPKHKIWNMPKKYS